MNEEQWEVKESDVQLLTYCTLLVQHEDYERRRPSTHMQTDAHVFTVCLTLAREIFLLLFLFMSPPPHPSILVHHLNSASYLPTSLCLPLPLSLPISASVTLTLSLPTSLSLSRSRKVKPPRRLMDENGIKMKAHFQIMKICSGRLGSRGSC